MIWSNARLVVRRAVICVFDHKYLSGQDYFFIGIIALENEFIKEECFIFMLECIRMQKKMSRLPDHNLNALVWQEEDLFVARCLEIEVASQGKTESEVVSNLEEALDLHLS